MKMPFGCNQGRQIDEIEESYIHWLFKNIEEIHEPLLSALNQSLADRKTVGISNRVCLKCGNTMRRVHICATVIDGLLRFYNHCPMCNCIAGSNPVPSGIALQHIDSLDDVPCVVFQPD